MLEKCFHAAVSRISQLATIGHQSYYIVTRIMESKSTSGLQGVSLLSYLQRVTIKISTRLKHNRQQVKRRKTLSHYLPVASTSSKALVTFTN